MKALWITDLHVIKKQEKFFIRFFEWVLAALTLHGVDYIIITGDIFDHKDLLFGTEQDLFRDFLLKVPKHIKVIALVGNHDWCREYDIHSLEGFKDIPNFQVVDRTNKLVVGSNTYGFMSYCRTEDRFDELKAELGPVDALFCHADCNGFTYGDEEERASWSSEYKFEGIKVVYTGHYHTPQSKLVNGVLIIYLGTQYTVTHNESDQNKRYGVIDLETNSVEFFPTPFTLHKSFYLEASEALAKLPEIPLDEVESGVKFRVVVKGTAEEVKAIMGTVPYGYKAEIIPDYVQSKEKRLEINASDAKEVQIDKFIEYDLKKTYGSKDKSPFDIERLRATGLRYINKGAS